jgi:hypothetical protein
MKRADIRQDFLVILIVFLTILQSPAQNTGPTSPDHISLIPGESVDYRTGDFFHSIPVISIPVNDGSYDLELGYKAGITKDQESSWVGLGWYLSPGAIMRTVNGYPDDWKGGQVNNYFSGTDSYNLRYGYSYNDYCSAGLQDVMGYTGSVFNFWQRNLKLTRMKS